MRCLFTTSAGLLAALAFVGDAAAVDMESSGPVTSYDLRPQNGAFYERRRDGRVGAMGRAECIDAFENNQPIGFYYSYSQAGGEVRPRVFAAEERDSLTNFECDSDGQNSCTNIEDLPGRTFTQPETDLGYTFQRQIQFERLVEEAVEDLAETNDIELLRTVDDCIDTPVDQEYFLRLIFPTDTDAQNLFDLVVHLDTLPPASPDAVTSVAATENSVFLNWEQQDPDDLILTTDDEVPGLINASPFRVFYSTRNINGESLADLQAAPDVQVATIRRDNPNEEGPQFSGSADIDIDGNAERIWVAVATRDDVENLSEPTYPDDADDGFEVVPVIDFWEGYREAGGREAGGCNSTGSPIGPSSLLFAALGLGFLGWRRRRRLRQVLPVAVATAAFGLTMGAAGDADAQSSTWGVAELRLGGYYPSIDDEEGLQGTPFQDTFGEGNRVLVEYEQGFHLFEGFGDLGPYFGIGYTHFGGDIQFEEGSEVDIEGFDEATGFMVVPARIGVYYRADQFEENWSIPLVPYAKAGLDYVLWQAEDPGGDASTADGAEGEGGTWGWHAAVGLQLQLDWIDPSSAAHFDYNWGINHTYAFAELRRMEIDDFGSSDSFILSDNLWMFGLAFEY